MSDTPTTVNQAAKTVDQIISGVIFDAGIPIAEAAIIAAQPVFGLPIIKQLLDYFLKYFGGFLYRAMGTFSTLQIIALQTNSEKSAYANAEKTLRAAHASGDPVALQAATDNFKRTFRDLVHYDGSANT